MKDNLDCSNENATHPPLNAPTGLRKGNVAAVVSIRRLEVRKERVGCQSRGEVVALERRREGIRSLAAMLLWRIMRIVRTK